MATTIEIAYYNTFILSGGANPGDWHVEESRIKGGFNEKSVDLGVKAFLVDDKYKARRRPNAMIYSGIYNSKTNVNQTNQFNISEDITKAVDSASGSIQKLYAEDTNLIIFQENKVSRALIDKDAIFTQEGQPLTTASKVVIGQIAPFSGKFGISKNPESFAVFGNRKYFTDKKRGVVLRLSQDGLTPISDAGMRRFFADNLKNAKRLYGMYDEQKNKYILSLHGKEFFDTEISNCTNGMEEVITTGYYTLGFDEATSGWVSFYTFKPCFGFSLSNEFYTWPVFENYPYEDGTLKLIPNRAELPDINNWRFFRHHSNSSGRCNFYEARYNDPAKVRFVFNDEPEIVKNFSTIDYTGTDGWEMTQFLTDMDIALGIKESTWYPPHSQDIGGGYMVQGFNSSRFKKKENKKVASLRSDLSDFWINYYNLSGGQNPFHPHNNVRITDAINPSGVKGYYANVRFEYLNETELPPGSFNETGLEIVQGTKKQELFSVSTGVVSSSESTYL